MNEEELKNENSQAMQEQNRSAVGEKVSNEIKKRISKTSKAKAAKKTILKILGPYIIWALVILMIIIIVVGIIIFFVTMPGMVMDKIKDIAKNVGNAISSLFGADKTEQISDQEVYDALDYLEEMGYDLKGYGFLTGYVDNEDDGVARNDENKIEEAKSDFIFEYLVSDNYCYTIKNFNVVSDNFITGLLKNMASILPGNLVKDDWTVGMIEIYNEDGDLYKKTELGHIKIDLDSKELIIKRGWFNNEIKYKLDGWTGRYGMPIDFLVSVHLATMMPDLAYDMATKFDTVIKLDLNKINNGDAQAYYQSENGYATYDDFAKVAGTTPFDGWRINKKEAMSIMKEYKIESPENCTGPNGELDDDDDDDVVIEPSSGEPSSAPEGNRCSDSEGSEKCCKNCTKYIRNIYEKMKKADTSNLKTYQPYISKVTNHWYRDVYFVADANQEFVDYDYEYEAIMKERWTQYEEDEETGEFIYYVLDEKGNLTDQRYYPSKLDLLALNYTKEQLLAMTDSDLEGLNTTRAEIEGSSFSREVAFGKKAVTRKIKESAEDLGWNVIDGVYTAYKKSNEESVIYQKIDPNTDDEITKNLYTKVTTTGNLVQTGEGQRTETNPDIKKMFLQNTYFRYDGTKETAEIITALRNSNNIEYGSLSEKDLEKTVTIDGKEYKAADYAGQVTLSQDSLNAFSMLENTHTLDADYIYRDFKELIVELGYFEKEELTDETPRITQWLIPETGSYGYPNRSLDKSEHEYGTKVHSKGDIDAHKQEMIVEAIMSAVSPSGVETGTAAEEKANINEENTSKTTTTKSDKNKTKTPTPKSTGDGLLSLDEWWESQQEMFDVFKEEGWTYLQDHSCATFEDARSRLHTTDCSLMASWALQRLGALKDGHTFSSHIGHSGSLDQANAAAKDLLEAGAEPFAPNKKFSAAVSDGTLQPGDVLFYDGHVSIYCGDSYEDYGDTYCWDTGSTNGIQAGGPRDTKWESRDIKLVVRLPLGISKKSEAYEGYKGNEAVVSPVTGVLLEYGTYEDEKDSITGEEYRVNTDLKYGTKLSVVNAFKQNSDETQIQDTTSDSSEEERKIVRDKVGYAKILVLDKKNFEKLQAAMKSKSSEFKKGLLDDGKYKDEAFDEDDVEKMSDLDKTLYGYKEFAELYDKFGIEGNTIIIDGFKCELPDENYDPETGEKDNKKPNGTELKFEDFGKITINSFDSSGKIKDSAEMIGSLYEKDEEYKLASQKATEKLLAEISIKETAATSFKANDLIFIKEGTILGRTLTDREVIEDYGDNARGTYEENRGNTPETQKVIGNYVRIIMRDNKGDVVENVEDYMKLDDGEAKESDCDFMLFYFLPFESGAAEPVDVGGKYYSGTACYYTCSEGETAIGIVQWTAKGEMCNQRDQFLPYMQENYPQFYSKMSYAANWGASEWWYDEQHSRTFEQALLACDEMDREGFLEAQMECAKVNYLNPLYETYPWLEGKHKAAQAEILHLKLWGANIEDLKEMSDEDLIYYARRKIANTSSTAGPASGDQNSGRAFNEPEIGLRILDGTLSEADVEQFVRKADFELLEERGVDQH